MSKLKPSTLKYFDYFEVEGLVTEALDKKTLRDFKKNEDFWVEYVADQVPGNDCYTYIHFGDDEEDANQPPWIAEICKKFREIIGDEGAYFRISW